MSNHRYPLASEPFLTVQGEGPMLGLPMVFVRLSGCSVGCRECDTDYGVRLRMAPGDIAIRCREIAGKATWAWVTGGEPTDHDLRPLFHSLWGAGFQVALATSGHGGHVGADHLSVSPHDLTKWRVRHGHSLNIVPGLNGLNLAEWGTTLEKVGDMDFSHRSMTPMHGDAESLAECVAWVESHAGWRLGVQAHKVWGLP